MKKTNHETKPNKKTGETVTPESKSAKERHGTSPFVVAAICLLALAVGVQGFFVTKMYLRTDDRETKVVSFTVPDYLLPGNLFKPHGKTEAANVDVTASADKSESKALDKTGQTDTGKPDTDIFSDGWDPFKEMSSLHERMNRLFGNSIPDLTPAPTLPDLSDGWSLGKGWAFNHGGKNLFTIGGEVQEEGNAIVVTLDLPDVDEESLDIEFEDGVLSVSGRQEKVKEQLNDEEQIVGRSRSVRSFSRKFAIPVDVKADAMSYKVIDGKLKITLPKIY